MPKLSAYRENEPAAAAKPVSGGSSAVEYVNIGLMVLSLVVAAVVPFELFLVSYAVLGPLHYLTEISWLHDRQYFSPRKVDWLPLVLCAVLITLGNESVLGEGGVQWLDGVRFGGYSLAETFRTIYPDVTFFAFGVALVFVVTREASLRLLGLLLVGVCAVLFHVSEPRDSVGLYYKLFGVYLPTLIHVFVFTGAFILAGALKRQSVAGYLSFAAFLICGVLAIWLPNLAFVSQTEAPAIFWRGFRELSFTSLHDLLRHSTESLIGVNVYTNEVVLRLVRFLAFAYTYHYLNWFSKTSIIQWHAVPPARLAVIGVAWVASIGLYAVNYDLGLKWLFLLSLIHVLLEFPLNHKCFMEIGGELKRRMKYEG